MRTPALALAAALALALATPSPAGDESLVLQPTANTTGPGGTIEIQVLARLHPNGKAVVPVRVADVSLTAKGGGTVAPATEGAGEVKWVYRAPDSVASPLDVTIEARVRSYPDAAGACAIRVTAPATPAPAAPPAPAAGPAAGTAPAAKPATPAAPDDEDGDLVEGGKAEAAEALGRLVTLEKWKARGGGDETWNEKEIPERGKPLVAPGLEQEFHFRVNAQKVASVEVLWWRGDRGDRVRKFSEGNRRLEITRDQDGLVHAVFRKELARLKGEYTFSILVRTEDGKIQRENLLVHRDKPRDEGEKPVDGKKKH
jgi:hypothetical protein